MDDSPTFAIPSAVVKNSPSGMVWQKANSSGDQPPADSIRLFAAESSSTQDGSRDGSFHSKLAFFPISAWRRAMSLGFRLDDGKNCRVRRGPRVRQQIGQHGRLVAGVIGQDVGGEGPLGVGTVLAPGRSRIALPGVASVSAAGFR